MPSCLAVFGSTGRTGRRVVESALRRGLRVQALIRRPDPNGAVRGVSEIAGSFDVASDMDRTLAGCSGVCIVFGPRPPYTEIFCADATESILCGMRRNGIDRVVCLTGAMIGSFRENRSRPFEFMAGVFRRRHPAPHADRVAQEERIRGSGLMWTLIKPPRLTAGRRGAGLEVGPDVTVGLLSAVSRLDLGELIVDEILEPRFARTKVFVRTKAHA